MSKVEKDEKKKQTKTWKGLLSACPPSGEIVEHKINCSGHNVLHQCQDICNSIY